MISVKKAVIVFLLALLFVLPAKAEVMLGDLVLELADEHEYNDTINRHSLTNNVRYLDNTRELKIGEIYDVDIVENTVLIAISYYDYTQVWIYNLSGDFQYGYELPFNAKQRSYILSTDGSTVLIHSAKSDNIIGLTSQNKQPVISVYKTPISVIKWDFVLPKRSSFRISSWTNSKVIVSSPSGKEFIVVDFLAEYNKYKAEYESKMLPFRIVYYIFLSLFIAMHYLVDQKQHKETAIASV